MTMLVNSRLGTSIQAMMPSGAPASTAASSTIFAAAMVHFLGPGMGADDDAVAGLQAISVLKMAVEVGLVVGITAAMTPMGSAILVMP